MDSDVLRPWLGTRLRVPRHQAVKRKKAEPGARLCENSIFQKCTSKESIAYDIKNAKIRGFHTVWRCT
jgi:hypothetical protein